MSLRGLLATLVLAAVTLPGCRTTQHVSLECVPHEVVVFVDGRELDRNSDGVDLPVDEPHAVFFRGGGYEPQLVVLESVESGELRVLSPADVCTETTWVPVRPKLELEIDREAPEARDLL